jgi:hypothetical protein
VSRYRTGGHWGVTVVREGVEPADHEGRRPDAELAAVVVNGDRELARRIADLLTKDEEV